MITLDTLRGMDACAEARRAFERAFPEGAADWLAITKHPLCRESWYGWIAVHAPNLTSPHRLALLAKSDHPDFWRGEAAAFAPGLTFDERRTLIEMSNHPSRWRGAASAYAPGLTLSQREALAAESNDPERWLAKVAQMHNPRRMRATT